MTKKSNLLSIQNLKVSIHGLDILKGISMDVEEGSFVIRHTAAEEIGEKNVRTMMELAEAIDKNQKITTNNDAINANPVIRCNIDSTDVY